VFAQSVHVSKDKNVVTAMFSRAISVSSTAREIARDRCFGKDDPPIRLPGEEAEKMLAGD
jgi:hypothetical protein